MLLHDPVRVGGGVAGDTHGSKRQGEEEVRQDAPNDDQHVDPRLQDKRHRGVNAGSRGLQLCCRDNVSKQQVDGVTPQQTKHKNIKVFRQEHLL